LLKKRGLDVFLTILECKISQDFFQYYPVHKYCIEPVCPDRLTLRYYSCNTYLLHRRAELKAATGSRWLMRNWTLGNNEPLAVSTGICGVIFYWAWKVRKQLTFVCSDRLFCIRNIIFEFFLRNSPSIRYGVASVKMEAINIIVLI